MGWRSSQGQRGTQAVVRRWVEAEGRRRQEEASNELS
jgi:hypothetical protein